MNVGPIQRSPVETDVHNPARQVRISPPHDSSSGNDPVREVPTTQKSPPVPAIVEDDVKVQWDASVHLRIYQFVNQQSGALVLQVPSEQVLNVTHEIQDALNQESLQIAQRQSAALETAGRGGKKVHGS
jgi:hypothetical protein